MSWKFSFPGLIYLTGLFLPNLFWTWHKPQGYEVAVAKENHRWYAWKESVRFWLPCLPSSRVNQLIQDFGNSFVFFCPWR